MNNNLLEKKPRVGRVRDSPDHIHLPVFLAEMHREQRGDSLCFPHSNNMISPKKHDE